MSKKVNISLDEKTLAYLDNMAADRGLSRSAMITYLVRAEIIRDRRISEYYAFKLKK